MTQNRTYNKKRPASSRYDHHHGYFPPKAEVGPQSVFVGDTKTTWTFNVQVVFCLRFGYLDAVRSPGPFRWSVAVVSYCPRSRNRVSSGYWEPGFAGAGAQDSLRALSAEDPMSGQFLLGRTSNALNIQILIATHEGEGYALLAGAAGAADAVDVIVVGLRDLEIDHVSHVGDIKSASRNIGCNKNLNLLVFE